VLSEIQFDEEENKILKGYQLLTSKPRIYLLNGKEEVSKSIIEQFNKNSWKYIITDILSEQESADFSKEERASLGIAEDSELDILIRKAYELLDLITFLTTGEDETRAWTLKKGQTAPQAGGVIHSDFESKFIKADVINWQDLLNSNGFAQAREKGLIRTEGKEYVVQDGDVIEIKSNA